MNKKIIKEKRIDEDMTIGELAIMVNNGFTNMQDQINELRSEMVAGFDYVDKRFIEVSKRFDQVDKKFDIIDKNMTNPYEFQNLVLRVDKIEEKTI